MASMVQSAEQAIKNISKFQGFLAEHTAIQSRMSFPWAWFGAESGHGNWSLAPSRFAALNELTPEEYLGGGTFDGRRLEKQLAAWFEAVSETNALSGVLGEALAGMLRPYGKVPSAKCRFYVSREALADCSPPPSDQALAELIIAVARGLSPAERAYIRSRI